MSKVVVQRQGVVAEMVIDGPPLNLFDAQMISDAQQAVDEVHDAVASGQVRALLLRAEGKVFCGGVDVHEFQGLSHGAGARLMANFLATVSMLEALPIPTLSVVDGLNLTIGFEFALGTDLLWASERASFGLVEASVGLIPGSGGAQRVAARAGIARAAELVFTADVYPAREMYEWGVVNRLRPQETLLEDARAFLQRLAHGPTKALAAGKEILKVARDFGVAAADARTPELAGRPFATADLPHGITSLLENGPRKATFQGR